MVGRPGPPPPPRDVWETLAQWRLERRRFAMLTVIESRGFTPQKAGAHMLLDTTGETAGTVGGGAIEHAALAEARVLLRAGKGATTLRKHLTQDLGMCCGGEMTLFVEVVQPAARLLLFGAGTIARPLAAMAATCGFEVIVVDERPEWASPERFPTARVVCRPPDLLVPELAPGPGDFAVVVTHDHPLDQRIVQALLRTPVGFLGMVGSLAKQRKFALRLRARGFGDQDLARLRSPLGLRIGALAPEEIAVSVLAELIAVRRGVATEPGWVPPPGAGRREDAERDETMDRTEAPLSTEERTR